MTPRPEPDQKRENTLLLTLLALFLFASPLTDWWAADDAPWFLPYLLWLAIILIGAWLSHRYQRHDL